MKRKGFIFIQILLLSLIVSICLVLFLQDKNSLTRAQSNELNDNNGLIRVGISTNDFSLLEYDQVNVTSDKPFEIYDKSSNSIIAKSAGTGIFLIKTNNSVIEIYRDNNLIQRNIAGPVGVRSCVKAPIQIVGLTRVGKPALYRGELEIVLSPTKAGKFSVVNILSLEDYLKGVVPNELPPHFGLEAVKAQAVAARNYVIKPRVKSYRQFDICDSVQCQVYFGYNTEHPLTNKAVEDTSGLVALYNGDVILALYSSTAGGYTENYENAFSNPSTGIFPANPIPYLRGVPDITGTPRLDNEELARIFYTTTPLTFDNASPYFRWTRAWTREELENTLNKTLSRSSNCNLITPRFEKDSSIGALKNAGS